MAKERIGKVQRWILTHAYLKETDKLPIEWKDHPKRIARPGKGQWPTKCLRRDEVMLNCFNLQPLEPPSVYRVRENVPDLFVNDGRCNAAYCILSPGNQEPCEKRACYAQRYILRG